MRFKSLIVRMRRTLAAAFRKPVIRQREPTLVSASFSRGLNSA